MVMHPNSMIISAMVVALAALPARGVADVVDIANSIRSEGCAELPAVDRPLRTQVQLTEAARRVARGHELKTATSESGYRAKKFASIHIRANDGDSDVAQILAQRFCEIVADESLQDVGVFRRGDDTWMVLAMPLSPPEEEDASAASRRVLELINEARAKGHRCGRRKFAPATSLKHAVLLERAARVHAEDMAAHHLRGHMGSDGSMPAGRATRAGYSWAAVAENVAGGQTTADEVVDTWLDSAGHCANLMNPRYSESGVARVNDSDSEHVVYWVQVFAAPE